MWIRFTSDFDFKPIPQATIAYKAGQEVNVTTPCAEAAVAKGVAVKIRKDRKTDEGSGKI